MPYIFEGHRRIGTCQALAFMGLFLLASVVNAETPPTTVQNVDEPARNPYQQTVSGCGSCAFPEFSAVPSGKRLRITNVSCAFYFSEAASDSVITGLAVKPAKNGSITAYVPMVAQGQFLIANAQINLYASAGDRPYIDWDTVSDGFGGYCTLSGYYVTL